MNDRIIRTKDGRVYRCAECPYRNRETGFCGFCMRKILDEAHQKKKDGFDRQAPLAEPIKDGSS